MWRKGNPHAPLVEMQISTATLENSMELPQLNNGTALSPSDYTSCNIPKGTLIQKNAGIDKSRFTVVHIENTTIQ